LKSNKTFHNSIFKEENIKKAWLFCRPMNVTGHDRYRFLIN